MRIGYVIWAIVLIIEVVWVGNITSNVHNTADLFFASVLVLVTISLGVVGAITFQRKR